MRLPLTAALVALALAPRPAQALDLQGRWLTPAGVVHLSQTPGGLVGVLEEPAKDCAALSPGMEVLHGSLLEDSFTGELRVCLDGASCVAQESFVNALLVVGPQADRMSGAVERGAEACHARVPAKGGVSLRKLGLKGERPKPRPAPPAPKLAQAQEIMRDAAQYLQEGAFEKARARFQEALAVAPLPEAYNGVGVTFFARGETAEALKAYQQAVEIDPNFGDSYYNMACLYARSSKPELAFKYLRMSVANGYAEVEAMEEDHDLDALRKDPRFEKVMKEASKRASKK